MINETAITILIFMPLFILTRAISAFSKKGLYFSMDILKHTFKVYLREILRVEFELSGDLESLNSKAIFVGISNSSLAQYLMFFCIIRHRFRLVLRRQSFMFPYSVFYNSIPHLLLDRDDGTKKNMDTMNIIRHLKNEGAVLLLNSKRGEVKGKPVDAKQGGVFLAKTTSLPIVPIIFPDIKIKFSLKRLLRLLPNIKIRVNVHSPIYINNQSDFEDIRMTANKLMDLLENR